ncbi:MAG TPA: radical SAM protein, partial [Myxococcota bacterium]|nr:radical SAM protein [Myxococcota bacterium]
MILPSSELSARYRTRAPRYTSYPAAPHFGPLPEGALDSALAQCRGPLSLYVHIPFCTHLCLYCGCHVEIRESRSVADPYIDGLLQELDLWLARVPETARSSGQICLGGGTPTFLRADQMRRLVLGLQSRLPWRPDVDASIEIDPRSVDEEALENLVSLGFNRYSFGVQDFDEEVLKKVARPQTEEQVRLCTSVIRRASPSSNLNFDLMYGLP